MIRVAIADDHPEMRVALQLLLSLSSAMEIVCVTSNGQEAVDCVKQIQPDVLVMDIHMPVLDGFEATKQIAGLSFPTRVILISTYIGHLFDMEAAAVGASGYIPKDDLPALLLSAIETVHRGELFFAH